MLDRLRHGLILVHFTDVFSVIIPGRTYIDFEQNYVRQSVKKCVYGRSTGTRGLRV